MSMFAGCGVAVTTETNDPVEQTPTVATTPNSPDQPANAGTADQSDAASPAFQNEWPVPNSASPAEVVTAFLEALRSGDENRAAALLTDVARRETERENLTVQPPGSPSAKYQVGITEYVSSAQEAAHVNSVWKEADDKGIEDRFEIKWVLRHQKITGWRVKGMLTELIPQKPAVFLDFEAPRDMFTKLEQADAEIAQANGSDGVRQADHSSSPAFDGVSRQ